MLFDTGRLVKALGGVDGVLRVVANARGPVADVLVVTRRSMGVEELRDLWDAWLEYLREGRVLRILILGVCEYMALLETGSPVMRSIEEGGVVVLDRGAHVEYARKVLEKAERWLSEAEKAMYNGALDVAAAVAYAAVDLVIKAALALKGFVSGPGSEEERVAKFGELYVEPGEFPRDVAARLGACLSVRTKALYEVAEISRDDAGLVVAMARYMTMWLREKMGISRPAGRVRA